MKKLSLFCIIIACFWACDTIEGPYYQAIPTDIVEAEFETLDPSKVYRKILFEEYTGHICVNCPEAHERLAELHHAWGDTLVPIAIHAGAYATVSAMYPEDFTTPEGKEWANYFNISSNPRAVVNRQLYGTSYDVPLINWPNAINAVDRSYIAAAIQLVPTERYNKLKANVKVSVLENISAPVQLSIVLIEDNIISPQSTPAGRDTTYVHNHVLRAVFNGTFGTRLTEDGYLVKDESYEVAYTLDWKNKWVKENCSIVAFLINKETDEVIQVEHTKL